METLQDWKAALASGVKIETLLGLDKNKSTTKSDDEGEFCFVMVYISIDWDDKE